MTIHQFYKTFNDIKNDKVTLRVWRVSSDDTMIVSVVRNDESASYWALQIDVEIIGRYTKKQFLEYLNTWMRTRLT